MTSTALDSLERALATIRSSADAIECELAGRAESWASACIRNVELIRSTLGLIHTLVDTGELYGLGMEGCEAYGDGVGGSRQERHPVRNVPGPEEQLQRYLEDEVRRRFPTQSRPKARRRRSNRPKKLARR